MTRFIALPAMLCAAAALAQPTDVPPPPPEPPVKVIIFDDPDEVGGRVQDPNVEHVLGRLGTPGPSLIRVRVDFQRELLQSAEIL